MGEMHRGVGRERVMIVAHRGASHDAPENTLPAFELAWAQGADAIEVDVHLSRDGEIVCMHDSDTQRVAGTKLVIRESTLAELRALDVGAWHSDEFKGTPIPLLSEVLATVPQAGEIRIEIKCGADIVPKLLSEIDRAGLRREQIVMIAFDASVVYDWKRQTTGFRAFWLHHFPRDEAESPRPEAIMQTLCQCQADGLSSNANIPESCINRLTVSELEWHVWTIDDPAEAERMLARGARSITTNHPGLMKKHLPG